MTPNFQAFPRERSWQFILSDADRLCSLLCEEGRARLKASKDQILTRVNGKLKLHAATTSNAAVGLLRYRKRRGVFF